MVVVMMLRLWCYMMLDMPVNWRWRSVVMMELGGDSDRWGWRTQKCPSCRGLFDFHHFPPFRFFTIVICPSKINVWISKTKLGKVFSWLGQSSIEKKAFLPGFKDSTGCSALVKGWRLKSGCSTSSVWSNGCLLKSGSSTSVVGSRGCRLKSGSSTSWIKGLPNGFVSVGCPWWCVVTPSVQNILCNLEFYSLIQICSQYFLCWRFLDQKIVQLGQDFS